MKLTAQELIGGPRDIRPHVVLLGAGASRAAFPEGDANGKILPLMSDLVSVIKLQPLIDKAGLEIRREQNFEAVYSKLVTHSDNAELVKQIEHHIVHYFSGLSLPKKATIYDRIVLALRSTDAVFTFNWDPFLFDAYRRNFGVVPLPEIFFLHGNVRIGACRNHERWGARNGRCPDCGQPFTDVPLLYPIVQKDYSKEPCIRRNWEAAEELFRQAFTITIFGYGAPDSDADAIKLLQQAWKSRSERKFEHIELIDTADEHLLHKRWSPFTPTLHYYIETEFEKSRIARWPRRSCEASFYPMTKGVICEDFPLPSTASLMELQVYVAGIAKHEQV